MSHKWQGKAIVDPAHHADLERDAAALEFGQNRIDRKGAEEAAYKSYKTKLHTEAIQHHLKGMRAAVSQGDQKIGEAHNAMYNLHMKALGHYEGSMPPAGVDTQGEFKKVTKFVPHPADQLLIPQRRGR